MDDETEKLDWLHSRPTQLITIGPLLVLIGIIGYANILLFALFFIGMLSLFIGGAMLGGFYSNIATAKQLGIKLKRSQSNRYGDNSG